VFRNKPDCVVYGFDAISSVHSAFKSDVLASGVNKTSWPELYIRWARLNGLDELSATDLRTAA
jgi:hypothetical protein